MLMECPHKYRKTKVCVCEEGVLWVKEGNGEKLTVGAEFVNSPDRGRGTQCVTISKQYAICLLKRLSRVVNRKQKDEWCFSACLIPPSRLVHLSLTLVTDLILLLICFM